MHLNVVFFKGNYGFQTLNKIYRSMWIARAFIHVCRCSSATSSHSKEAPPYLMSSWHHHTIFYLCLVVGAQWQRWSPSMMIRDLFGLFSLNSNRVRKFAICSMLVQFWSHSTCYSPIMNDNHSSLIYFEMRNVMSRPTCTIIPLHAAITL